MKLTKEARKLARQVFRESFTNGALSGKKVQSLTALVIEKKPRQYIGVLQEFARLIRLELAKHHATIESAESLGAEEKEALAAALKSKYGSQLTSEYKTNAALLGGVRIQVGSDVLDASVRTRLERLAIDLAA